MRACDRCWALKTQCDAGSPCSRCRRLGLECGDNRPVRRRGRPKRHTADRTGLAPVQLLPSAPTCTNCDDEGSGDVGDDMEPDSIDTATHSEQSPSFVPLGESPLPLEHERISPLHRPSSIDEQLVMSYSAGTSPIEDEETSGLSVVYRDAGANDPIPNEKSEYLLTLGLSLDIVTRLLSHSFAEITWWGLLAIILDDATGPREYLLTANTSSDSWEILCALLAIALQVDDSATCLAPHVSPELVIDTLRIEALRHIPTLTWKSCDVKLSQASILVLFSHFWCMHDSLVTIALSWNSLARIIWIEVHSRALSLEGVLATNSKCILEAIEIQETTLMLLHPSYEATCHQQIRDYERDKDDLQPNGVLESTPSGWKVFVEPSSLRNDLYGIILPLARLLRKALQNEKDEELNNELRRRLEQFYLDFPSSLVALDAVTYPYQAEAMIWFHGVYMLTYSHRDLLGLLLDPCWPSSDTFFNAFEHSLLLAEVLPTLLSIDPSLKSISASTTFFILLSSIISAIALWQFHEHELSNGPIKTAQNLPHGLRASIEIHIHFFDSLLSSQHRFNLDLFSAVCTILKALIGERDSDVSQTMAGTLYVLGHYRWCDQGTGIIKMTDKAASRFWHSSEFHWAEKLSLPTKSGLNDESDRRAAIIALCNPEARVCRLPCFDLNIRYLSSPEVGSERLLHPPLFTSGLILSPRDNQSLRRLIYRCQIALVAINGSGDSMLHLLLPHAIQWPEILHGMMALAVRGSERSTQEFYHHEAALVTLQREAAQLQHNEKDTSRVLRALCCSLLLAVFGFSQCDGSWAQHIRGMVSIIRTTDRNFLEASKLGRFLISACAHQDISAFSVGKLQRSHKCWLSWKLHQRDRTDRAFSPFETLTGYPESLVTVIAFIAEHIDDAAFLEIHDRQSTYRRTALNIDAEEPPMFSIIRNDLESSLKTWQGPLFPLDMPTFTKLALQMTWDAIRKAACIFLWRGAGFHSDLRKAIRPDRKSDRDSYVTDILSNVRAVFALGQTQKVSVGNALLWPLTIVGCECGYPANKTWQTEVERLLVSLRELFSIDHALRVRDLLQTLWQAQSTNLDDGNLHEDARITYVSLESLARDAGMVIPLL